MDADITLKVDNTIYSGWKSVDVSLSMEAIAGTFALEVTDRWSEQSEPRPIRPGARCEVSIGDELLITGFVDMAKPRYDANQHSTAVEGRDAAGDLVDCSAVNDPDEWNERKLEQIAEAICRPFNIAVTVLASTGGRFKKFKLQPGETAFSAIERLCRARGMLAVSDGRGGIAFARAGTSRAAGSLISGQDGNVLGGQGDFSDRERHSTYIVRGWSQGNDNAWGADITAEGRAEDKALARYRPLLILAESQIDQAAATDRAKWQAAVRAGKARRAVLTAQGWLHGGRLWRPNTIAKVKDSWLDIDGEMLIAGVRFRRDEEGGTRTQITVVHPRAYELIALPEDTEEPGW